MPRLGLSHARLLEGNQKMGKMASGYRHWQPVKRVPGSWSSRHLSDMSVLIVFCSIFVLMLFAYQTLLMYPLRNASL